jgi:hypothetical protein
MSTMVEPYGDTGRPQGHRPDPPVAIEIPKSSLPARQGNFDQRPRNGSIRGSRTAHARVLLQDISGPHPVSSTRVQYSRLSLTSPQESGRLVAVWRPSRRLGPREKAVPLKTHLMVRDGSFDNGPLKVTRSHRRANPARPPGPRDALRPSPALRCLPDPWAGRIAMSKGIMRC